MSNSSTVFIIEKDPAECEKATELLRNAGWGVECFDSVEKFLATESPARKGCLVADLRKLENGTAHEVIDGKSNGNGLLIGEVAEARAVVRGLSRGSLRLHNRHELNGDLIESIRHAMTITNNQHNEEGDRLAEIRARRDSLSLDERQVMDLVIAGKPNKLIAKELNIGLRTVESRRHNIFEKMQADSLAELIKMTLAVENS